MGKILPLGTHPRFKPKMPPTIRERLDALRVIDASQQTHPLNDAIDEIYDRARSGEITWDTAWKIAQAMIDAAMRTGGL